MKELTPKGKIITGYKATDENMCCRGFQYELGKWYEHNERLEMCVSGFHFCEYPSGPWSFYPEGRLFKCEAEYVLMSEGPGADLKHVAKRIRLVEEIKVGGDGNTGDRNTGHWNTGNGNTGQWNTGDRNTGHWNTGNGNTGHWNTGYGNTGDRNTGDRNTGDRNTGHWNTGNGNCGDYHSGSLCHGEAPFFLFNLPADRSEIDFSLVRNLSYKLMGNEEIDPEPFLSLPNATPERIKALHDAHKSARAEAKGEFE